MKAFESRRDNEHSRRTLASMCSSVVKGFFALLQKVRLAYRTAVLVSIITKQSAEKLRLKPGAKAYAIVKASSVMIGVD